MANIQYFDVAAFVHQLQAHPQLYGFTQILPLRQGARCPASASCQQTSIFADDLHLSAKSQTLLGNYIAGGNPLYNGTFANYGAIFDNVASSSAAIQATAPLAQSAALGFSAAIFDRLDESRFAAAQQDPPPQRRNG